MVVGCGYGGRRVMIVGSLPILQLVCGMVVCIFFPYVMGQWYCVGMVVCSLFCIGRGYGINS